MNEMFDNDVCNEACDSPERRIARAKELAFSYAQIDGSHHKMWVIDQMLKALCGSPLLVENATDYKGQPYSYQYQANSIEYDEFINEYRGELTEDAMWGEPTYEYEWDDGCAP